MIEGPTAEVTQERVTPVDLGRMPIRDPASSPWLQGLTLDLRSLALFRVAVGSCLLFDLLGRIPQIGDFYTDDGVLPREALFRLVNPWRVSLHLISGEWAIQLVLFLTATVFALGFILGYRTRLSAVVSWLLLTSMQARNPMIAHGGDAVLRVLLFWSMFLPLNGRFSLDKTLSPAARPLSTRHLSAPGIALIFQVCAIYWFAFAEKMHPVWLTERSAVYYALNLDMFATSLGRRLLAYPELLKHLTTGTLLLEFLGPVIALSPRLTGPLRLLVVLSFVTFHTGLGLCLRLGTFSWVMAAAWTAFLPPLVWQRLARGGARLAEHGRSAGGWILRTFGSRASASPPREVGLAGNFLVLAGLSAITLSLLLRPSFAPALGTDERGLAYNLLSMSGLGQQWRMFAPTPTTEDGWYVIEGVTRDGERVDLWNGGVPTDEKPADFGAVYRNAQWLGYLALSWDARYEPYRVYFGRYLCRKANAKRRGGNQIDRVYIYYMLELTPPPGKPLPVPDKQQTWRHYCLDRLADS